MVLNLCLGRVLKVRPARQVYRAAYKLKVLAELETADSRSECGEILRREGLYSSRVFRVASTPRACRARGSEPKAPRTQR